MGGEVFLFLKLPERVVEVIERSSCASLRGSVAWSIRLFVFFLSRSSLKSSEYYTSVS